MSIRSISILSFTTLAFISGTSAQELCTVTGEQGPCAVTPFIGGGWKNDKDAHTCNKLKNTRYQGSCTNGQIQGLAILKIPLDPGDNKPHGKPPVYLLANFKNGSPDAFWIQYVYWGISYSLSNGDRAGCVSWDQGWDRRKDNERRGCILAPQVFGSEILEKSTWKAIRSEEFQISSISFNSQGLTSTTPAVNFLPANNPADDPKATGFSQHMAR